MVMGLSRVTMGSPKGHQFEIWSQSGLRYIVSYIFHLSKHLNLVRCLVLAPGHVAEVDQIPDGWHDWVEEEAEAQEDEEVPSS